MDVGVPGLWLCPRCHRKFPTATVGVVDQRHGFESFACPNCHEALTCVRLGPNRPVWLARLRRRWVPWRRKLFGSDLVSLAVVLYVVSVIIGLVAVLVPLWFHSAGFSRAIAIAWLFWVPWSVYRLVLIRWPTIWPEDYWKNRLAMLGLLVGSIAFIAAYIATAREVTTVRYEDGTTVQDFSIWFGKPHWREVRHWRGKILERSYGALAPSGELHGKWVFAPWGERWYWYDEPVSADMFAKRDRMMRGQ